jgi:hypothetical protein
MPDVTLQFPPILDPRAHAERREIPLAPRLSTLEGARLLLFDNGKLHRRYGHNAVIFQTIARRLEAQYHASTHQVRRDLLSMQLRSVRTLASELVQPGVDAVVLALCDSGVTAFTVVLAWEIERLGVPTVTLCSGQCLYLAATMSHSVLPGLPLSQLDVQRYSSPADNAAESLWVIGEVEEGLTATPEQLRQQFLERFASEPQHLQPDADGNLHVWPPQQITGPDTALTKISCDPAEYAASLYETLCEHGMCDGLPVIPPTRQRVEAMLAGTDREPSDVLILSCFPSGLPLTVGTLAVNAVMAGCRPEYLPILQTAALAIAEPPYRLTQATITSHPAGNAILVSGPLAQEIGLASAGGCLGPGFRANMTIGRALNLSLLNTGRALPDRADLSTFGSPAEIALCCAENIQESPWPPRHAEVFDSDTTSVTVCKCEAPHNVLDHLSSSAEGLLRGIADVAATLGGNNAYVPADLLVLLNPEHARIIHDSSWSKADVQRYLFEQARNPRELLQGRGISPVRPAGFEALERLPVVSRPEDVIVMVAGTHGPHSMVGIPWGYSRAVTRAVTRRDGQPARHIGEFRQQ